jgi:predicted dehydrogenase
MTKPLRLAVIGAGWASELHLHGFAAVSGVEPVAIASRTRERAEDVAARFGIPSVYDDAATMLAEAAPDIVSIATPPGSHREYTLLAAEHGCHVLCDKPAALNAADAEIMLRAAEQAGVRHATGFIWRNDPGILKLRALLAEGAIGKVTDIHCRSAVGAPVLPMTWLYEREAGGGALMQHGQHVIDRAGWLLGDEIVRVRGELLHDVRETVVGPRFHNIFDAFGWAAQRMRNGGGEPLPTAPVTADTGYAFSAVFGGGVRGHFWESWHTPGPSPDQIDVHGTRGALSWSGADGLRIVRPGPRSVPEPVPVEAGSEAGGGDLPAAEAAGHRRWGELAQAFADDIRGTAHAPYPTLYDAWRTQQVVDAVCASSESGVYEPCAALTDSVAG